jgi:hypothetical protein
MKCKTVIYIHILSQNTKKQIEYDALSSEKEAMS